MSKTDDLIRLCTIGYDEERGCVMLDGDRARIICQSLEDSLDSALKRCENAEAERDTNKYLVERLTRQMVEINAMIAEIKKGHEDITSLAIGRY